MESSRRPPFDRSREPGLKKPRLAEVQDPRLNPNGRSFSQRPPPLTASRYRASDNSSDSSRTEAYQPQPVQQPPFQELVSQYKTALAELTFNSKPIITNLTIIAGENLHAAKAIAATVCNNIIEVPSDQKLPSLYLLDSIVKNIGRDYIKYFASRLPEVFCKAYRQVDPTIHRSMRHLFGTWKGVFPLQTLQVIEKELGFSSAVNGGSSGATASRPDSQSQRPAHSIHVNPKILERQRLQQSNRDIQLSNKDALAETAHRKNIGAAYGDDEYGSDIPGNPGLGSGRTSGRIVEQGHDKPLYGAGIGAPEILSNQRNGFSDRHGLAKYSSSRSTNTDPRLQPMQNIASRSGTGMTGSWKDTEEEEFMWDSESTIPGAADNSIKRKAHWIPDDPRKRVSSTGHLRKPYGAHEPGSRFEREPSSDSLSADQKDQEAFGNQISSLWSLQDPHSGHSDIYTASSGDFPASTALPLPRVGGKPHTGSSYSAASSFGLSTNISGPMSSTGGHQKFPLNRDASSLGPSSVHRRPPSPSVPLRQSHQQFQGMAEQNQPHSVHRPDVGAARYTTKLNIESQGLLPHDSPDLPSTYREENFSKLQSENLRKSSSQIRQHYPSFLPPQSSSDQDQNPPKANSESDNSDSFTTENAGQLNTSALLSTVIKSGILPKTSIASHLPDLSNKDKGHISSQSGVRPPLHSGSQTIQGLSSLPPSLPVSASLGNKSAALSVSSQKGSPPLPTGPPPASRVDSVSTQGTTTVNSENHLSSLLSSLVAKGLISASETKSASLLSSEVASQLQKQGSGIVGPKSDLVSSSPSSSAVPCASAMDEVSSADTAPKKSASLVQSSTTKLKNLIGFEFRSDVLREFHSSVIHELFDELTLACSICGLRLKHQEQLDRHLEWHTSKESASERQWFTSLADWISGKTQTSPTLQPDCSIEKSGKAVDDDEPMVPADESQCVCILCGEIFEDFYSQERDEWMFRGAVLMNTSGIGELGTNSLGPTPGPIVHANCISETSMRELGVTTDVKMENV